jgi:hypothetical protein
MLSAICVIKQSSQKYLELFKYFSGSQNKSTN